MIVVDANIIAYFFIEGDKTARARELRGREPEWRVPSLWRHEYLNVLATFAREGGASVADVAVLWKSSMDVVGDMEHAVDMEAALELAVRTKISAYDAQYITLAQQLRTVCVTEDKKLRAKFPRLARTMAEFL